MKYNLTVDEKLFLSSNLPTSQNSEVLYYLLTVPKVTTKMLFSDLGILNPTARVSTLRAKGLNIKCKKIDFTNKFGRDGQFGVFTLTNTKKGIEIYKKLIKYKEHE